jgi:hypothetical protein
MRLMALVVATGLLWPESVLSQQTAATRGFLTGNELFRYCSGASLDVCNAYISGVADAVGVFNTIGVGKLFCVPSQAAGSQVIDVATQYLTAHPETRHLGAAGEVVQALQRAFPCKEQAH